MLNLLSKLFNSPLFINGQSYIVLPNKIIHTMEIGKKVFGEETSKITFEFWEKLSLLKLKDSEIAILFTFVLTQYSK